MPKLIPTRLRIENLGIPSTSLNAFILLFKNNLKLTPFAYFVIAHNYLVSVLVASLNNNRVIKEV